jgi:hypothetical protein
MGEWNMKKALVIVAILGMVAVANAEFRVWFTGTDGLGLPANLIPHPSTAITSNDPDAIYTDNLDVTSGDYVVSEFPNYANTGAGQNCTTPYQTTAPDDWMFIWGQFYGVANNSKVFNAHMQIKNCTDNSLFPGDVVWYKVDDMGGDIGDKRWDGASTEANNYATFRNADQLLVGVTGRGLVNAASSDAWNMFSGGTSNGTTGRIALLGAVRGNADTAGKSYQIVVPADINGDPDFVMKISGVNTPIWPVAGAFKCVPEPASMLLIGLAGLLIRRR